MAKTILIADDSEVFRKLEEGFLTQRGYRVLHASNGAETMKVALNDKPQLILLDVQMPVMDGVQVLAALKKNPGTQHIPVIVVTTIGREHDAELLARGGADDFLAKPINGPSLLAKVQRLIGE